MKLRQATAAVVFNLAVVIPAYAEQCPHLANVDLQQKKHAFQVARPNGEEMCFSIPKSAGIAVGRITVLTVRPFLKATADEIEVLTTTERTRKRGTATHNRADITAPDLLGGGQIFFNADDERHTTIRVRPRHAKDYRLIVVAHEIDVPQVLGAATMESLAAMVLAEMLEGTFGKDARLMPFLDERVQHAVLKSVLGIAKDHSPEQIMTDVTLGLILKEAMAGHDLPRPARIAVATFVIHIWRELSKGAVARYDWTLSDDVRDTSKPVAAAFR